MGLDTGWIVLRDPAEPGSDGDSVYKLAAHINLPPALGTDQPEAWAGGCECLKLCSREQSARAYNIARCSRLAGVSGDRRGLAVHASTPLRAGGRILGVLNVAAPDWPPFNPRTLALLRSVGRQMGVALERAQIFEQQQQEHLVAFAVETTNGWQRVGRREPDGVHRLYPDPTKKQQRKEGMRAAAPAPLAVQCQDVADQSCAKGV